MITNEQRSLIYVSLFYTDDKLYKIYNTNLFED